MQNQIPSSYVQIPKRKNSDLDGEIIDFVYNIVEEIFSDINLKNKMTSFGLNSEQERVLLIKNLNNLEQYLIDLEHRYIMFKDKNQEMFLIDDLTPKHEDVRFAEFVNKYQEKIDLWFDDFKNNFMDRKINIVIPNHEIELRECNRTDHYQSNQNDLWQCNISQTVKAGEGLPNQFFMKSDDKNYANNTKLRTTREAYLGKVLGIRS